MYIKTENLRPDYGHVLHAMNAKKGAIFLIENIVLDNFILMNEKTIIGMAKAYPAHGTYALTLQFPLEWFEQIRSILQIDKKTFSTYFGERLSYPGPYFQIEGRSILFRSITVTLAGIEQSSLTGEKFIPANVISPPKQITFELETDESEKLS